MKNLHYFKAKDPGLIRYFLCYRIKDDYEREIDTKLEIAWKKNVSPGFRFHIGSRWSETPIDIMVSIGFLAFFWSLNFPGLGAICATIGRGHKRNISLSLHDGNIWWELWYDDDGGYDDHHQCDQWALPKVWPWSRGPKKYRSWMCLRRGSLDLNPLDAIWGRRYYHFKDVETITAVLPVGQFRGDEYKVELTLQKQTRYREDAPKWARGYSYNGLVVSWKCKSGIPFRNDNWKGDKLFGSGESVQSAANWVPNAVESIAQGVVEIRERYNFVPSQTA